MQLQDRSVGLYECACEETGDAPCSRAALDAGDCSTATWEMIKLTPAHSILIGGWGRGRHLERTS